MPEYPVAHYRTPTGWTAVGYEELKLEHRRAELKGKEIRDAPDGLACLGVRNHETTPHFFRKRPFRQRLPNGGGEGNAHRIVCEALHRLFTDERKVDVGYYEAPWNRSDPGFDALLTISDYDWARGTDASIGVVYGRVFIPDLLGRSRGVALVDSKPYVAWEVVDTHFHSLETFEAILKCTHDIPLVVCFFFQAKNPYLNAIEEPERANGRWRVRLNYYISDGSFWERDRRFEDRQGARAHPSDVATYYHLIKAALKNAGAIRT